MVPRARTRSTAGRSRGTQQAEAESYRRAVTTWVSYASDTPASSICGATFGCPVGPVVLDDPEAGSPIAVFCRATFGGWEQMLADHLSGRGVPASRARTLATTVVSSVEGALVIARARRDTAPLEAVADELKHVIRRAIEDAGGARASAGRPRRR